jgi:simple sugar transport system substrate-binding protein
MRDEVLDTIEETQLSRRGLLLSGGLAAAGLTALGRPTAAAFGAAEAGSIKIAVVTHGDTGSFWSVFKKGVDQAKKDLKSRGVSVTQVYANNDVAKQVSGINAAIAAGAKVIATSVPDASALKDPLKKASAKGIEIITVNSGLGSSNVKVLTIPGAKSDIPGTKAKVKAAFNADKKLDAFLGLDPDVTIPCLSSVPKGTKVGTFDVGGAIKQIRAGKMLFAIDQQQYLQGYLPVVFAVLYRTNLNTVGNGQPVLTGPGIINKANAAQVAALAAKGTR